MTFNNPQELLNAIAYAYYTERNIEKVLSCVTDDVEWVGTEKDDIAKGKTELKKIFKSDFAAFPDGFSVDLGDISIKTISSNVVILTVTGTPHPSAGNSVSSSIRGTICCVKTEQGWLVSSGHTSVPHSEIENISLHNALNEERAKQKALLDNVPGGVAMYRLKKDGRISTDYVSDGIARICGYDNSEDIMKVMGYDSRRLVLPEDYPVVAAACKASLEKGVPTSINYRVYGKDGNPVRITLDSVVMKNTKLGKDDVAVFYAVQTLVSEEATLKAEADKILLSLLNTVPAGIGIFDVNEDGITQNYLNDTFYYLIGSKREDRKQFLGSNALDTTHPKDVEKIENIIKRLVDGDDHAQVDYRVKGGNGNWVWLHLTAAVVRRDNSDVKLHVAFYECTETKQQEIQLLQNQKAVKLAEEHGRISIWTYNIDKGIIIQQILAKSKGYLGYPGYITNVPKCFVESGSIYPEDVEKFLASYEKLEAGEKNVDVIYRLMDQNNDVFNWVRMYYQRMENNDDGDRMAVGFSIQINKQQEAIERYQIEQKLREQMYADAILYMEYNLTNNQYVGKNNLPEEYRHGRWETPTLEEYRENMSKIVDEPYLDEIESKMYGVYLLKAFEDGETKVYCEYRSKESENRPSIWCRITAVMVRRPDTGDVMAFVYVEDIENEKNRQLALERSMSNEMESIALIRLSDKQAWLIQTHNNYIPEDIETHFVYDDNFVNKAHNAVVSEDEDYREDAAYLDTVVAVLEKEAVYQYSVTTKRKGGKEKRQLFRFRYLDDRKTNIVMSINDISLIYLEEQKKKQLLENALREAKKASSAKAEFYSRMSHDMRTPMNGILGMAALSVDETDSKVLKENIGKIRQSGEYLLSLINDTLDIQRIESGKMKLEPAIVNTSDVVRHIIEMVSVNAKAKGVKLKYSKGNTDLNWYIRADALRLKQIFINLLSNAVKFTPEGGTVELEFHLLARDGMISHDVIYVRDTGIGMSEEFMKTEIFKPFSQESNKVSVNYVGSGLGLSIAKSLVELMGGRIEVHSELGVGTTFAVYLDFERVSEEEVRKAVKTEKDRSDDLFEKLKGKNILLAEDHPINAEISIKLLRKVGCQVTWAKNGEEVISYFEKSAINTFDVILMDIRMPIMDGLEATRKIRALDKEDAKSIPIIAMTANAYGEDVKASLEAGMNAHLGKPIKYKTLYATLARYMQK